MRRVLVPAALSAAGPALGGRVHSLQGETMGTGWAVKWVGAVGDAPERLLGPIQAALDRVVSQMSTWDKASDLCRFNRAEGQQWHPVPDPLFRVMKWGWEVASRSGGACDLTAGPMVDRWGFGPRDRHDQPGFQPPNDAEVAAAQARCGWQRLRFDELNQTVWQDGGVSVDLSGIAKGFGVDEVARALRQAGVVDFLVEVGGELRGEGVKPDGTPWWVSLEAPPGAAGRLPENLLALHGLSVATSGNYRKAFMLDGQCMSHTIDPRSGRPVAHGTVSATVLHAEAVWADAWSTAMTVLPAAQAVALADQEQLAVHLVVQQDGSFNEHTSRAFDALTED